MLNLGSIPFRALFPISHATIEGSRVSKYTNSVKVSLSKLDLMTTLFNQPFSVTIFTDAVGVFKIYLFISVEQI